MPSAPIILHDDPKIARERLGDLFDGTEIDRILTLLILAMSVHEKRRDLGLLGQPGHGFFYGLDAIELLGS